MALRRQTPSSAQLTGGDLSVDVLHTEDSVTLGDGTNLIGTFSSVDGVRSLPTKVNGVTKTKLTDSLETDYAEIDDVGGEKALKVSVIASVGGGGGGTAATDSAAFTAGATQGTPIMGARDDTSSDTLAEGEMGICRMTTNRALHVEVQNSSIAVTGTFWQATQPVSGTVSVTGVSTAANQTTIIGHLDGVEGLLTTIDADTGNISTKIDTLAGAVSGTEMQVDVLSSALPSGASTSANQTTIIGHLDGVEGLLTTIDADTGSMLTALQIMDDWDATAGSAHPADGVMAMGSDGTNARRLKTDTSGELQVDVLTMPTTAVSQSGTWNINALTSITNAVTVVGSAAHDNGSPGVPVMIAGRAKNTNPTAVADGDVTYFNTDLAGRQIVSFSDRALVTQATGTISTTTEATILSAGGANVFLDLTQLILTNEHATSSARVQIRDATAGTIRFEQIIPASSGMVVNFPVPFKQTTANNNWTIDLNAAVSTVYYTVQAVQRLA